jgi:hypothetical protein
MAFFGPRTGRPSQTNADISLHLSSGPGEPRRPCEARPSRRAWPHAHSQFRSPAWLVLLALPDGLAQGQPSRNALVVAR